MASGETPDRPIVVTGASGFLGRHLVAALEAQGHAVCGLSRRTGFDVTDRDLVRATIRRLRPGLIYHLAGPSFVPDSRRDPTGFWAAHVTGTLHLLEAVRELADERVAASPPSPSNTTSGTRILLAGSADSYRPDPSRLPFDEETPMEPENPYAAAKLAQEGLGVGWHRAYGLPIVRVRLFNVIGPGQGDRFVASNFAMQAAHVALGRRPARIETGDLRAARDFIDWRDAMAALQAALTRGKPGDVYNVATGIARPIGDILNHYQVRAGIPMEIVQPASLARPDQSLVRCGSARKLREHTGWVPTRSLPETLDAIYDDWLRRTHESN